MKPFSQQLKDCSDGGFIMTGRFMSFKEYPEFAPRFQTPKINAAMADGWDGIFPLDCLRFGGACSSANEQCRKMRELT